MIKAWKKTFFIFLFLSFFLLAGNVFATEVNWPTSPLTGVSLNDSSEFHEFIAYLYGWGIGLGALFAFGMLIYAGIEYMTSVGDPGKIKNAINRISSALFGLALLLGSWMILNTINPQITKIPDLPPLWDTELTEKGIFPSADQIKEPPCEFVLLYSETNYSGSETKKPPGTYDTEEFHYKSAKMFRKMTKEEEKMYKEFGEDSIGREVLNGSFIEGTSCSLIVYEGKNDGWLNLKYTPCGTPIGTIPASTPNLTNLIQGEEEDTSCYMIENVGKGSTSKESLMPGAETNE